MAAIAAFAIIGTGTTVTDAQATGTAHSSMKVGATVMPMSCPAGRNLRSCIKPVETSAQAQHYDVSNLREGSGEPLKLETVSGQLVVVTLTY